MDLIETSPESRISNTINPFPVSPALFEDTSTYDLPTSATAAAVAPTRINGLTSRVNGSSTLAGTTTNDSKYAHRSFICIVLQFTMIDTQFNHGKSQKIKHI